MTERKTKINLNDFPRVAAAIERAENGCRTRKLRVSDLGESIAEAEAKLAKLGIPKKYWRGCEIQVLPERVANSYRGIAYGTGATMHRYASGWFLTWVGRDRCDSCSYGSGMRAKLMLASLAVANIPTTYTL